MQPIAKDRVVWSVGRSLCHDCKLCNKSSAVPVAEMGDRMAIIDMGRGEELGPHLTQYGLGRGLPPYQVAS